jgi:hypothetical protein
MTKISDFLAINEILYKRAQQNRVVSGPKFVGDKAMVFPFNGTTRKSEAHDISNHMTEVWWYSSGLTF